MDSVFSLPLLCLGFFLGMLMLLEAGRRLGVRRLANDLEGHRAGSSAIEGALFALFGLLIAFTFSGAAQRFDTRRQLVVDEANNIGTAYLRIDLLIKGDQGPMREHFRKYLDSRLATYRLLPDVEAAMKELSHSVKLQGVIWNQAVAACQTKNDPASTSLVLSALNAMIDITTTRAMSRYMHPPLIIFVMLLGLGLGCALLAGYGMAASKVRNLLHMILFSAIMAVTVYVIFDIEYPRMGFINVDAVDKVLVELRQSMN